MPGYEVYLHISLLEAVPASGPARRRIMNFVHHLRDHPATIGDFTDRDASLRERQIKVLGDFALTYWLDEPVKRVMIVDIRPADQ